MDNVCFNCTRPRASERNEQKCFECVLLYFLFWCIIHCTFAAKCMFAQTQEKERILVTAVTFCKRTELNLAHAWTDIKVGSGCTSDFYATTARCWHTATLLYSGNSEKVHLVNPKDITPLDIS